ncbi:dipeptidase PepV [Lutispora saccharofermentans]|uniref:Dipeptidase PepV n=1 Tax=Lutispora saccharofermentans TaxID=3024236 RepID=A0ABT1NJA5_9FIRM|nr:dipeptidase PepV [Lutispora saccharofermentans]MCQ1531277.1 dipeptidase PepV [Lutispora saccharofermentans]
MGDLKEKINCYKNDIVKNLCEFVRIESIESNLEKDMPFGKNVNDALNYMLNLSNKLGFRSKNLDNYVGYCEYGIGEELIGILGHIDVVEASNGWKYPPFEAQMHDGKIYGRGTIDDKGPLLACMYALYLLKESNININKRVRIIFGTNEETGWKGIKHYVKEEEIPSYSFTPDANFPVIHGEKGILGFHLEKEFNEQSKYIKNIKGGISANVVPSDCKAILYNTETTIRNIEEKIHNYKNISYNIEDNEIELISTGKSSHSSQPELGENAISNLLRFLMEITDFDDELGNFINCYSDTIGFDYNGNLIFGDMSDDISGKLTFNLGKIEFTDNKIKLTYDIRYPISYNYDDIYKKLKESSIKLGYNYSEFEHFTPIYIDKNSKLIKTLMSVYSSHTGDNVSEPLIIGGGTYAKAFENCVAFGPVFPNEEELAHGPNEFISIDRLLELVEIYTKTIEELIKL